MSKRKLTIAVAFSLAVVVAWIFFPSGRSSDDEKKYRRFCRNFRVVELLPVNPPLPVFIKKPLRSLSDSIFHQIDADEKSLLSSGYLTNAVFIITNASIAFGISTNAKETMDKIEFAAKKEFSGYHPFLGSYSADTKAGCVTVKLECRTQDVETYRRAFAKY